MRATENNDDHHEIISPSTIDKKQSRLWLAPLWTVIASILGVAPPTRSLIQSTLGTIPPLQSALALLMLSMGLTITPQDLTAATRQSNIVLLNMVACFGMMPLLAALLAKTFQLTPPHAIGTILLGCVSGGQASNLFALLAGGDVALSVVCTFSTTVVGVLATPLWIQCLLKTTVPIQATAMLRSIASLVLIPLTSGLLLGYALSPKLLHPIRRQCPNVGLAATMVLVAGGASNASSLTTTIGCSAVAMSCLLPVLGGAVTLGMARLLRLSNEASVRTLVIEVFSKSPTLAHVLALRHFGGAAAAIPAVAMVSLALLGALVAAVWQSVDPQ
ncbi:Probable sodium/metabolite cotransporter BASS1, chloroplastic [Seminavis robusta]|uniref:Probable sodium/metabolite cotransporter BASS1, chloroplastic n=1 Tax=Seminavis robusta TaxID=568900 RepID=A0A9N8HP61_9STRA|nr:Probable sodium/metabolite cotransporter BASS1, chloroplastic [Seminavis robusta]|eukprot:Sro876_g214470.1 Probable sodium/metabolite cotransporter BASS1, chloroplastic (331) ;mRNA; f:3538-4530